MIGATPDEQARMSGARGDFVASLPRRALALLAAGVLVEFTVAWAHLARLISGGPPFAHDINHRLKTDNGLQFLYDAAGGEWVPFAALALLAQAAAVVAIARLLRSGRRDGPPDTTSSRTAPAPARRHPDS